MTVLDHPFRVLHYPQIPCKPFVAPARTFEEAIAISYQFSMQHLWLFAKRMIPDYSNVVVVQVWDGEEWEEVDEGEIEVAENTYAAMVDDVITSKCGDIA